MPRRQQPDHHLTLSLKLKEAQKFIQTFEEKADRARAVHFVDAVIKLKTDPTSLLKKVRNLLVPIAELSAPRSLIEADLQQAKAELGPDFERLINRLDGEIWECASRVASWTERQADNAERTKDADQLSLAIFQRFHESLEPAKRLRERLISQLRMVAHQDKPLTRRDLRRQRNKRLRKLRKEHPTLSVPEFIAKVRKDKLLKSF